MFKTIQALIVVAACAPLLSLQAAEPAENETTQTSSQSPDSSPDMTTITEQAARVLRTLNADDVMPTLQEVLRSAKLSKADMRRFELSVILHLAASGFAPAIDWLQAHASEQALNEIIIEELETAPLPHWPVIKMAILFGSTEHQHQFGTFALLSAPPTILKWLFDRPLYKRVLLQSPILNKRMAHALLSAASRPSDIMSVIAVLTTHPLLST